MSQVFWKYRMVLRAGLAVMRVRLLLRRHPLSMVMERLHPSTEPMARGQAWLDDLIYYVDRWLQMFPYNAKGNCYPRSLAIYRLARQMGYPVRFHCGVRKVGASLDGHAWLTLDEQPFHEPTLHWRQFVVTFSFPPDSAPREWGGVSVQCDSNVTIIAH